MAGKLGKLLKKAKKTAEKKPSKSKSPSFHESSLDDEVDKWLKGKKMEKDGAAMRKQAENVIIPRAMEEKTKACRDTGEFHSSIDVNDKIKVKTSSAYSGVDSDEEEAIREVVGDDFESWFKEETEVKFNDSLLKDEDAMEKIIDAIGEENFDKMFTVKQTLKPTKQFHEQRTMDADVEAKAKKLIDEGILRPFKPSVVSK